MVHGILADANCEGHSQVLLRVLHDEERRATRLWHHLNLAVLDFRDLGLASDASDREVWERCQQREVILVTANRNADTPNCLEATIQLHNTPDSLPVLTLANVERIRRDRQYAVQVGVGQQQVQVGFFPNSLIGQVVGRQHGAGRDQIDVGEAGLPDNRRRIRIGARVEQSLDARQRISFCQKTFGDVALGIGIDDQHPPGAFPEE